MFLVFCRCLLLYVQTNEQQQAARGDDDSDYGVTQLSHREVWENRMLNSQSEFEF